MWSGLIDVQKMGEYESPWISMFLVFARLYCLYPSNSVLNCIKVLIDHDDSSDGGVVDDDDDDDDEYICKS